MIILCLISRGRITANDGVLQWKTTAARVSLCVNMYVRVCMCVYIEMVFFKRKFALATSVSGLIEWFLMRVYHV
jgi:hypothetical protein